MNLMNIAAILEEVRIGDIKYGDYAVSRFNEGVKLSPPLNLQMTGDDLRSWLDDLDEVDREKALSRRLLSTAETQEFIQYLDAYRQSEVRKDELADMPYLAFGYITGVGSVVIILAGIIMYMSYAKINTGHEGVVWDGLGAVWKLTVQMIKKYFGVT